LQQFICKAVTQGVPLVERFLNFYTVFSHRTLGAILLGFALVFLLSEGLLALAARQSSKARLGVPVWTQGLLRTFLRFFWIYLFLRIVINAPDPPFPQTLIYHGPYLLVFSLGFWAVGNRLVRLARLGFSPKTRADFPPENAPWIKAFNLGSSVRGLKGTLFFIFLSLLFWQILHLLPDSFKAAPLGRGVSKGGAVLVLTAFFIFIYRLTGEFLTWLSGKEDGVDKTLAQVLRLLIRIVLVVVALMALIRILTGKPVATLMAGLGIGGLAVAFAAQDTLKIFFSSLTIMTDKPFKIGDRIAVGSFDGIIESIGFRSTRLRSLSGNLVVIPNNTLASESIENVGRRPSIKRQTELYLALDTPADKVRRALEIIRGLLQNHPGQPADSEPRVYFSDWDRDHLTIVIFYWFEPPDYWEYLNFTEEFNLNLLSRLAGEGISLAVPQYRTLVNTEEAPPPVSPKGHK
jgi:small-conductance mechanosensitive channel